MREQPSGPELLDAVSEFLRGEVIPQLSGRTAFHARVAVNVLQIVRREMSQAPRAEAEEASRLRALLSQEGEAADLAKALCERIAGGGFEADEPRLIDHLWKTTLATLAIDQPSYATYRRAAGAAEEP
jgi:hypothetical protein